MRILFILIVSVVYFVGHLISPTDFGIISENENQAAVSPTAAVVLNHTTATQQPENQGMFSAPSDNTAQTAAAGAEETPAAVELTSDPTQLYGESKTEDLFERGSSGFGLNAGLNDDENIRIISLNNRLSLEPKKNNGWITWRLRPPSIKDGAAQMDFSIITCARGDRTGLLMHSPDYNSGHGYYFSLSCEGTFSILRDTTVLDTADARGAFKNSSGDINTLTAYIRGNELTAFLNDQKLLTVTDDTYPEGFSGFFTSPQGQNTLTMDVLSFKGYYDANVQ